MSNGTDIGATSLHIEGNLPELPAEGSSVSGQSFRSVLFVCLGNICRSPLAEGIFKVTCQAMQKNSQVRVEFAGTSGRHQGECADLRARTFALKFGLDISNHRSRQISPADFTRFDLILCMDHRNLDAVKKRKPVESTARIELVYKLVFNQDISIPDPYEGEESDFRRVYFMLLSACQELAGERFFPGR